MANRNLKLLVILTVLLVNTGFILASLSVSTPYYNSKPLEMYAGQERVITFNIQNCPSLAETCQQADITAKATLLEGSDIAQITSGETYNLDYGSKDTELKLKVSIPSSASIGAEYRIKFIVESVPEGDSGVQLGLKYNVDFPVIIKDQSEVPAVSVGDPGSNTGMILTIIVLAIVILIALIVVYNIVQKKKAEEEM